MNDFLIWGMIFFSVGFALSLLRSMVLTKRKIVLRPPRKIRVVSQDLQNDEIEIRWYEIRTNRFSGVKEWYLNGKRHREDGPAIEYPDGSKEWWENGIRIKTEWVGDGGKLWWEEKEEKDARREEFEHEELWH